MRIYVDFNSMQLDPKGRVLIRTDLFPEVLPNLSEGAEVIIHDEEMEVSGRVEFAAGRTYEWLVSPNWNTRRDLI